MPRRPVLIVEDDPSIAESLAEVLTDEGYPVWVARDGSEALARMQSGPLPGLLLLDLMMPHMDGYELRRRQLADPRLAALPTWVVTAGGTEQIRLLGVEGWFRKPLQLKALLVVISRYCGDDNHRHIVDFYDQPALLESRASAFLADGLDAGESAVLAVRPERWQAMIPLLTARGLDLERLRSVGRLMVLDAQETLAKLLHDGLPHPIWFLRLAGGVIDDAVSASGTHRVRAFGEMVDLLWQNGQYDAALQLEENWNRLIDTRPLSLYCGYCTRAGAHLPAVAARHTRAASS